MVIIACILFVATIVLIDYVLNLRNKIKMLEHDNFYLRTKVERLTIKLKDEALSKER
ncbi:hypothetical protein_gp241 [Bacillus phage vB_BceM_WH1]|nr:hypothetical protein_gp241 [Bacillus phage vB_BceM_WH1]